MGEKEKHLCKLKDHIKEDLETYKKLVVNARFICLKCGRVARDESRLCKPTAIGP